MQEIEQANQQVFFMAVDRIEAVAGDLNAWREPSQFWPPAEPNNTETS